MEIFCFALVLAFGTIGYMLWEDRGLGFKNPPFKVVGGFLLFLAFYYGAASILWTIFVACRRFIVVGWLLTQ